MYYIYRFLDKNNNILYIGKTHNLEKRMYEHFSKQGHLAEEQYKQVYKIEFIELTYQLDMDILEKYLINYWKPSFNSADKNSDITLFSFNVSFLNWKKFNNRKIIKTKKPKIVLIKDKPLKVKKDCFLNEEFNISYELVNILNQSNLTLDEHKLLNAMFAQIEPDDIEFKLLTFYPSTIRKLCKFNNNHFKRRIINIIFNLLNKKIYINKNGDLKQFSLIKILKYENDILLFQFDNNLKPYLLDLKEKFFTESLRASVDYKNILAFKLSLLFSMEFDKETSRMNDLEKLEYTLQLKFSLEELKQLSLNENKYNFYANFKQRVLNEAIAEINKIEQYQVEINENKEVSKVREITFFIKLNKNNKRYIKIKEKEAIAIQEFIETNQDISNELKKRFDYVDFDFKDIYRYSRNQIISVLRDLKKELSYKKMSNEEVKEFVRMELYQFINKPKKKSSDSFWDSL